MKNRKQNNDNSNKTNVIIQENCKSVTLVPRHELRANETRWTPHILIMFAITRVFPLANFPKLLCRIQVTMAGPWSVSN